MAGAGGALGGWGEGRGEGRTGPERGSYGLGSRALGEGVLSAGEGRNVGRSGPGLRTESVHSFELAEDSAGLERLEHPGAARVAQALTGHGVGQQTADGTGEGVGRAVGDERGASL